MTLLLGEADAAGRQREQAVRAVTQKRNLQKLVQKLVDDTRARVTALEIKVEAARQCGQEDEARRMLREKQKYEQTLIATLNSFEQASRTTEAVKAAIRREEERIRQETWKNGQLPNGVEPGQVTGFLLAVFLLVAITFCLLIWLKA